MQPHQPPRLAKIAILSPPYGALTYHLPGWLDESQWREGQRVAVPMGKGLRVGVILGLENEGVDEENCGCSHGLDSGPACLCPNATPQDSSAPDSPAADSTLSLARKKFTLKPILWPLEREPLISSSYLELARQLALRHTTTPGRILAGVLPAGLRTAKVKIRFFGSGRPVDIQVKDLQSKTDEDLKACGGQWERGEAQVIATGWSAPDQEICVLAHDPPWPVRPVAKQQIALLEHLFTHGAVTRRSVLASLGNEFAATLRTLVDRGLVCIRPADEPFSFGLEPDDEKELALCLGPDGASKAHVVPVLPDTGFLHHPQAGRDGVRTPQPSRSTDASPSTLPPASLSALSTVPEPEFAFTPEQREAFDKLSRSLFSGKPATELLFGITGSGKTAIYLELARKALDGGKSVLLLAPEVALALKLWADVERCIPSAVRVLFHGYQSAGARETAFRNLARFKGPVIIVGTRSALFLPGRDIGLIILDEEHDASFKQDEGLIYQAKEVAWYRAMQDNALLVLGSATPDIKSFYAAATGLVPMHRLANRVGGGSLPKVELVIMPKSAGPRGLLAEESQRALHETVARGEQAVILLNRRGYAPILCCLDCGKTAKCPHCDISLAYHKGRERLLCHYCGWSAHFPCKCSECRGFHFLPMGQGTEKLEEDLLTAFPAGTGILRLDRDSTRRPGRMQEILAGFAAKDASVLVGTQMLSKGHHFPDVTLVVVADADLGLNLPDYRAAERTFQLLLQSSGRAGRGKIPGRVLIQTRDPSHYCWQYVKTADYEGFYEEELALRKRRRYPPFVRLGLIRLSYPADYDQGAEVIQSLALKLRAAGKEHGVAVLGPAPAPLAFLKGKKRFNCLLKAADWSQIRALYNAVFLKARLGKITPALDLDPVNMM